MRFSRARYVTLCQQSLVTAAVLAVGVSAAGVKTLDIVPQPATLPEQQRVAPSALPPAAVSPARSARSVKAGAAAKPAPTADAAPVDTAPVTPKVRSVKVSGIDGTGTGRVRPQARVAPSGAPSAAPQTSPGAHTADVAPPAPKPTEETLGSQRLVALSAPQDVRGYATVGVTWKHGVNYDEDNITVEVRTEKDGTWSEWAAAGYHDDHAPDATEEAQSGVRPGTDALVVGDVDQVQMRAYTTNGVTPPDLELAVVDPGAGTLVKEAPAIDTSKLPSSAPATGAGAAGEPAASESSDGSAATGTPASTDGGDEIALSAMKVAPKPYIYSRAQWGANEKLREQSAPSYGTVKAGFIHHTVNANNYTADQVPALLRGIYAYHTQSRGWRDIGYNYLVDRFGRIWEGRWGGVDRAVVGAHTLGYNEVSFAMSAIGNFDIATPPPAVASAYARLFAWKLSLYNIRADATRIYLKDRYVNAINGHRDAGSTACPGRYLYAQIPAIRVAAQKLQNAAQSGSAVVAPVKPAAPAGPVPTGAATTDAKCPPAVLNRRSFIYTGVSTPGLLLPLQCLLKQQRLYPYAVTGEWNAETLTAIHGFQARVRHPQGNGFTRSDWTALLTVNSRGTEVGKGARGADVVWLQRALNAALPRKLALTGVFNKRTTKAVKAYQRRVGLEPSAVVSPSTWSALRAGRV
jgi:hypothetical protein